MVMASGAQHLVVLRRAAGESPLVKTYETGSLSRYPDQEPIGREAEAQCHSMSVRSSS